MNIVVCIRLDANGEPNPFDACAYEAALGMPCATVTLLSMGPASAHDPLQALTRRGAARAVLLSDRAFAGSDTLATARVLHAAIQRLSPDLILCGRQTLIGDTAQTGPMLAALAGYSLITNAMSIEPPEADRITCTTREEGTQTVALPALITVERINTLRLPRLRSRMGEIEVWTQQTLGLDPASCGLAGSPTRVLKTFENQSGRRKCRFISRAELAQTVAISLERYQKNATQPVIGTERLAHVCIVGKAPADYAKAVSNHVTVLPFESPAELAARILALSPDAVLWASDARSKRLAATVAAMLGLGLCADCTQLAVENDTLMMYRPALSGTTVAKIKSTTRPAMATVRTAAPETPDVVVGIGYGVRDELDRVRALADELGAATVATRKMVDNGYLPYEMQLGLTGRSLHPPVYVAVGISGAIHHVVGMQNAGTVIAINPDREAPIFEYADFGITEPF